MGLLHGICHALLEVDEPRTSSPSLQRTILPPLAVLVFFYMQIVHQGAAD